MTYIKRTTPQEIFWSEKIGQSYLENNKFEPEERLQTRSQFFDLFKNIDPNSKILECGCNNGTNLAILNKMGFNNLHGLEIYKGAVEEAKTNTPYATITEGTMLNLPYKDNEFDVVFTCGVLIHQNPENSLPTTLNEIYRVSKNNILGYEHYSKEFESRGNYRGEIDRYWSGPFDKFIQNLYPNIVLKNSFTIDHKGKFINYFFQK
tara:strand:+ start:423 stop:1040 length:618 start_codon:yes stop_codon:yes gene_type:complete